MVRNLMMILGMTLAVAAFGCSDDPPQNGGEGGSGGQGGSGGTTTPMDACINAADTALVCDAGFDDKVSTCAQGALGQGAGTSTCLQADPGLTADCADCYGNVTQCGFDNCAADCAADPDGQLCRDCVSQNCDAALDVCTGALDCGGGGAGGSGGAGGAT